MRATQGQRRIAGTSWGTPMTGSSAVSGSFQKSSDGTQIIIGRIFSHPIARIWEMLTESACLVQWLAPGAVEPRSGGTARLDFIDSGTIIDSSVTEFVPLQAVAYSWSGPGEPLRPLRFALEQVRGGTRLEVTL